jgi:hypothetical protein
VRTGKYKVITKREVAQMNRSGQSDTRSPVMVMVGVLLDAAMVG